jgi:NAD(P)-dependent dehydrogenase (short-subunit alcohol dehydrogenase family)
MRLQGRVAIIIGASSGVGYETARRLAREGASVVAAARRRDRLESLVAEIAGEGGRAVAIPTDVTDSEQVERLVESAVNLFGRVDILVNSAGVTHKIAPLEQFSNDDFRLVIETNLHGTFYAARAVIPHMKRQRSGTIVNIASRVGKIGIANIAPFCAAKFALDGLSQALGAELRPYNVFCDHYLSRADQHRTGTAQSRRRVSSAPDDGCRCSGGYSVGMHASADGTG